MSQRQFDQYVLLVRHAKPTDAGNTALRDVAAAFSKTLLELKATTAYQMRIGQILYGESPVETAARNTAFALHTSLRRRGAPVDELAPVPCTKLAEIGPYQEDTTHGLIEKLVQSVDDKFAEMAKRPCPRPNTLVIVGHDPQLGWLAGSLAGWSVPLAYAEIACFVPVRYGAVERRWRALWRRPDCGWNLWWTLAPDQTEAIADLRDKIKSKMDVAKVLGGFVTAGLTIVLGTVLRQEKATEWTSLTQWLIGFSLGFLFVAVWAFLATIYAYDSLLMPSRFWAGELGHTSRFPLRGGDGRSRLWLVWRPPSSAAWILFQNMTRIWNWMFLPATISVGLGLYLLAVATTNPGDWSDLGPAGAGLLLIGLLLVATRWLQPRVGSHD